MAAKVIVMVSAALVSTIGLSACGSTAAKRPPVVTVTVPPSAAAAPASTPSGSPSPSASSSPTTTALPGTCDSLLTDYQVSQALGGLQLGGTTAFVVGVPDTAIGRLSTINCRYGVSGAGAAATAKVEIGVSLYASDTQATTRISATADDHQAHGGTAADVAVKDAADPARTGTYLTGGRGAGYENPLLVVASERRTVAVTVDPAAVRALGAEKAVGALAALALQRTAG